MLMKCSILNDVSKTGNILARLILFCLLAVCCRPLPPPPFPLLGQETEVAGCWFVYLFISKSFKRFPLDFLHLNLTASTF